MATTSLEDQLHDALRRVLRHVPWTAGGASLSDDLYRASLAEKKYRREHDQTPLTPEDFAEAVSAAINEDDAETSHAATDALMEQTLERLGYSTGVRIIRETTRWYA